MGGSSGTVDLTRVLALYDANRFRDAHDLLRPAWPPLERLDTLTVAEMVHGARVALRLGGQGLAEWLLEKAWERDPTDPHVRIWGRWARRRPWLLLSQLEDLERSPELDTDDPALQASWLGGAAAAYGRARMFDRARRALDQAAGLGVERAWLAACEADYYLDRDECDQALPWAERAWELSPGMPAAADVLGRALVAVRGPEAAAERLWTVASSGQSYETLLITAWHTTARAELFPSGPRREEAARQALVVVERSREAAILADLRTRGRLARAQADVALVLGDHALLAAWADKGRAPFYRAVARSLEERPEGESRTVDVRPLRQTWNACLPAAVVTALSGLGVELDVDAMTAELTYGGTTSFRARDWLRGQGLVARPFVVRPATARALLRAGVPFVLSLSGATIDHAVTAVGYDDRAGLLFFHDPSSVRRGAMVMERLNDEDGAMGPRALAVVPAAMGGLLDVIPAQDADVVEDLLDFEQALATRSRAEAVGMARGALQRHPSHPLARRMGAVASALAGDLPAALAAFEALAQELPSCLVVLRDLLDTLQRMRCTARTLAVLREVVERGRLPVLLPGEQPWRYPPPAFVVRYADYLGLSEEGATEAERLLLLALRRSPFEAGGYHVLGDVRSRRGRDASATLPLLIAASLEDENDHYARGAAEGLRRCGCADEGLDLLRARADRLGDRLGGGEPLVTLAEALEDFGHPGEAQLAMEAAQARRPDDGLLHAAASRFWVRQGMWERAHEALAQAAALAPPGPVAAARTVALREQGAWRDALAAAAEWMDEATESSEARTCRLGLLALRDGRPAALALAREWVAERPGDEVFEDILHGQLMTAGLVGEAEERVRARLAGNPQDAWAARELGHMVLRRAEGSAPGAGGGALDEAAEVTARASVLAPEAPATLVLRSRLAEAQGDREGAVGLLLQAADRSPEDVVVPSRAMALTEGLSPERAEEVVEALEAILPRSPEPLHGARGLVFDVARRLGLPRAEKTVRRLRGARPDDPEVEEAHADLLLHFGEGRSGAAQAVELLLPALNRFPHAHDLRFSLAHAYGVLGRTEDERGQFAELLRRRPLNAAARRSLALSLASDGDLGGAVALLEEGLACNPLDADGTRALARILVDAERSEEAAEVLRRTLTLDPTDLDLREQLVGVLLGAGRPDEAVSAAREGVALPEPSAAAWLLLGETLWRHPGHTDAAGVESCLRSALAADAAFMPAADVLADLLSSQGRHDDARRLLQDQLPLLLDQGPTLARLAWLQRQEGDAAGARRAMAETLASWPRNLWGWNQLLDWYAADEAWEEACAVLAELPAQAAGDPELRARRLEVMERGGTPAATLAAEWRSLLADYPAHENLHLRRFDGLMAAGERDEAATVLESVIRRHPRSSFIMARMVRLRALQGRFDEAMAAATALWSLPGEDEGWPEAASWEALVEAGQVKRAVAGALVVALGGGFLRRLVYERMVEGLHETEPSPLEERCAELLELQVADPRDGGVRAALVLSRLWRLGARSRIEAFRRDHADLCRASTALWQELGLQAEQDDPTGARAREWFLPWRERPGLQGWALATYVQALRSPRGGPLRPEFLEEALEVSLHALHTLTHDGCARFHAVTAGEALLRLGRDDELLEHLEHHDGLLEGDDADWFMPPTMAGTAAALLAFGMLLGSEGEAGALAATKLLSRGLTKATHRWVPSEWLLRLASRVGPWRRRWVAFTLGLRAGWVALSSS